jgi:hypothetical protein
MMIRIAVVELDIIFGLLMYILQLNSVIRPLQTWPLASIFAAITGLILYIAEKKYRNNNQ